MGTTHNQVQQEYLWDFVVLYNNPLRLPDTVDGGTNDKYEQQHAHGYKDPSNKQRRG